MRVATFAGFVLPSVISMALLIAVPLVGVAWLAAHNSFTRTEMVAVEQAVPMIGGVRRDVTRQVSRAVVGPDGRPEKVWEYVGGRQLYEAADVGPLAADFRVDRAALSLPGAVAAILGQASRYAFWGALGFTLLYTFVTTPFVLVIGFLLALAIDRARAWAKGALIFATILPMVITPLAAALSIYWLFLDNAVVSTFLDEVGFGRIYFLRDAFGIRSLIILFGVWNAAPFAFIILYAGLQTVPRDTLEAAMVDGASRWDRVRLIVIPHLMPLFALIAMIHMMDSFRVFEPILVFGSTVFANSLQYLTYYTLAYGGNMHRAAAYSVLTVIGVVILLAPVLIQTWRERRVRA